MINILIAAKGNYFQILKDYFSAEKNYNIVGATWDINQIRQCAKAHKKLMAVVDFYSNDEAYFAELITIAKANGVKVVALCDNVKEGFALLNQGASDICVRAKEDTVSDKRIFLSSLNMKIEKVMRDYDKNPRVLKNKYSDNIKSIIAIGSSTGGTECLLQILKQLPANSPPILVVQHMPPVFTNLYSQRLHGSCNVSVWEAQNGDKLENGLALIAPGDKHMRLVNKGGKFSVTCTEEEPYGGHIPAVDVLFFSVAQVAAGITTGVILTGMGKDGADGLLAMRQKGSYTIGQDEKSCIVYGMPKAAYDIGAVSIQADPDKIAALLIKQHL